MERFVQNFTALSIIIYEICKSGYYMEKNNELTDRLEDYLKVILALEQ